MTTKKTAEKSAHATQRRANRRKVQMEILSIEPGGAIRAAVWPPQRCGCGRRAALVVNCLGKTRCVDCDAKATR